MQCPNCHNLVPDNANVCGHCGTHLHSAPTKSGIPGWVWGLIGAIVGLCLLVLLGLAGYYFLFYQPTQSVPQPIQPPPVQPIQPLPTEVPPQTAPPPLILPSTSAPPPPPDPVDRTQYCEIFESINFSIVYLDWMSGKPLTFNIKMPGGVPTLEKDIPGVSEKWEYSVVIGEYETKECDVIEGYKERLYCDIELPSRYANSIRPFRLYVSSCDTPIYENLQSYMPSIEK